MNIYDIFMKPLEDKGLTNIRRELMKEAKGLVLELGAGTGVNLSFYNWPSIEQIILTDVSLRKSMDSFIEGQITDPSIRGKISYKAVNAQSIPLADKSVDTVVASLVFCSVEDVDKGLGEIRRVLKDDGRLLFIEHVISKKPRLSKAMNTLNPAWKLITSGCNINRDYSKSLEKNGFKISKYTSLMGDIFISGIAIK